MRKATTHVVGHREVERGSDANALSERNSCATSNQRENKTLRTESVVQSALKGEMCDNREGIARTHSVCVLAHDGIRLHDRIIAPEENCQHRSARCMHEPAK